MVTKFYYFSPERIFLSRYTILYYYSTYFLLLHSEYNSYYYVVLYNFCFIVLCIFIELNMDWTTPHDNCFIYILLNQLLLHAPSPFSSTYASGPTSSIITQYLYLFKDLILSIHYFSMFLIVLCHLVSGGKQSICNHITFSNFHKHFILLKRNDFPTNVVNCEKVFGARTFK